jgi:hypothetical protein
LEEVEERERMKGQKRERERKSVVSVARNRSPGWERSVARQPSVSVIIVDIVGELSVACVLHIDGRFRSMVCSLHNVSVMNVRFEETMRICAEEEEKCV